MLLASVVFATIGPFGTYATTVFMERFLLWGGIAVASWGVSLCVMEIVALFTRRGSIAQHSISWAVFTVIFAPVVWVWLSVFFDMRAPGVPRVWDLFWMVGLIAAGIIVISAMVQDLLARRAREAMAEVAPHPRGSKFMRRIKVAPDTRLILLKSSDHRVEVYTDQGQSLLRMRLSDALDELEGYDGVRVHRSAWVARAAVRGHELRGDRVFLHLEQGHVVPVSRGYLASARAQGLLP